MVLRLVSAVLLAVMVGVLVIKNLPYKLVFEFEGARSPWAKPKVRPLLSYSVTRALLRQVFRLGSIPPPFPGSSLSPVVLWSSKTLTAAGPHRLHTCFLIKRSFPVTRVTSRLKSTIYCVYCPIGCTKYGFGQGRKRFHVILFDERQTLDFI
jgi:hypothetical protein